MNDLKEYDIILFKGSDIFSKCIKIFQKYIKGLTYEKNFSHCGMVISKKILPDIIKDDELYIFEATLSGKKNDGVNNIYDEESFGCQLRKLSDVIEKCENDVYFIRCIKEIECINFTKIYCENINRNYDYSICCSVFLKKDILKNSKFCSSMICDIFKSFGIVDKFVNSKSVYPMSYICDSRINIYFTKPEMIKRDN